VKLGLRNFKALKGVKLGERQRYKVNPDPKRVHVTRIAVIDVAGVATRKARIGPNGTPFPLNPIATGSDPKQQSGRSIPVITT